MNPASIDAMSWEMAEVYGAITDQIIINLAHYFPYINSGKHPPKSMFDYQAAMLAQMGKVNAETMRIIRNGLSDADRALSASLETAIADAIKDSEPSLYRGAKAGIFKPPTKPVLSANQTRAFGLYYKQSADKLNLVNTVMLESTQSAYMQTVSNVISEYEILERINRTQIALDVAAGETITGVSSWNTAVRHATQRMKDGGITGFVDHAGRHWDAETYVAMDIRTTMFNTGRAAVWETNEGFGNDLYIVSYHNGARPLCYDWQNKVISATNNSRDVADLDGNVVHVYAQNETTYGEPAGLFGINCKHYPTPFVPGVSAVRGQVQDKAENDKQYAESQKQRALERNLREQKRDLEMLKAQNAPEDIIRAQREKVHAASKEIDTFCDETGRVRRRNREAVYTKRDFPSGNYDPSQFAREQQKRFDDYWKNGGTQSGFTFGTMTPNVPLVPNPPPVAPTTPQIAPTTTPVSQSTMEGGSFAESLDAPLSPYSHDSRDWDKFLEESISYKGERTQYIEDIYGKAEVHFRNAPMSYGGEEFCGGQKIDNAIARMFEKTPLIDDDKLILCDYKDAWQYLPNGVNDRRYSQDMPPIAQVFQNKGQTVIAFDRSYITGTLRESLAERESAIISGKILPTVFPVESPETVSMHEWGHTVYNYYSRALCYSDEDAQGLFDWWKSLTKEEIQNGISEYASVNFGEFIAECYAEMQTRNPRPLAVKCFDFMGRIISKGYK